LLEFVIVDDGNATLVVHIHLGQFSSFIYIGQFSLFIFGFGNTAVKEFVFFTANEVPSYLPSFWLNLANNLGIF
jgi:hypothetical protein